MAFSYEDIIRRARDLRKKIEADAAVMDDEEALKHIELFPMWSGDKVLYNLDVRLRYKGKLYKVRKLHTSQPDVTPDANDSLYGEVRLADSSDVIAWEQVTIQNPVNIGGKVLFEGIVYESTINNNVWTPAENPDVWKKVE